MRIRIVILVGGLIACATGGHETEEGDDRLLFCCL